MRRLAPLAFLSPRIIAVIVDGTAPNLTVTGLARALPYSWIEQEQSIGLWCSTRRLMPALDSAPTSRPIPEGHSANPPRAPDRRQYASSERNDASSPGRPGFESQRQRRDSGR
jgi:hypothetical protein